MKRATRSVLPVMLGWAALALPSVGASADDKVIASIKPVHSLVAGVMQGVGDPGLIVAGAGSPHSFSLRPSQARALQHAQLVFWVGEDLETFLEKPIGTLAAGAKSVALMETPGLTLLALREGGAFDAHAHAHEADDDHGHDDDHADHDDHDHDEDHAAHDDHDHDDDHTAHDDHDHDEDHAARDDHDHDDDHAAHDDHDHAKDHAAHDDHGHGATDAHIWLDPENAVVMVRAIEAALVAHDPSNSAQYQANAAAMTRDLEALTTELRATLEPVKDRPFVVFHDAYQNMEHRFGLRAIGSITVSPEVIPGAERVAEIRSKVRDLEAVCVFSEPQFEPKLVSVVTEGTNAKAGVLDPLGASIETGPELYFQLMRQMAASLRDCLSPSS